MTVLLVTPGRDSAGLAAAIRRQDPSIDVRIWPETGPAAAIRFAVLWQQPPGLLRQLKGLAAVSSLGAGAEHVLADPDLPPGMRVGRLAGQRLAADMAAYLLAQVLGHWRRLARFRQAQAREEWSPWAPADPPRIGLLGTGNMAGAALRAFQALDVPVRAFNRSGRPLDGIRVESGRSGLFALAEWSDYLICLLPLTDQTRGILNADLFKRMRAGAVLVNVGRGAHLVEADLLAGLDHGRPGAAILDVFAQEPLPDGHPFWHHPAIQITPHCASVTGDEEAAGLIIESWRRVAAGQPPLDAVDRSLGY
ncbi:2-hydroxyacid dehydrogenase [Wenzhouxiangella limi]|uniref:Glyoxylate/hydroxypyruvate reductase A n=1 Tax=Wenzhouxiangella limi TaxID=2707351 RepID=A0A845UUE1_9GAMM|nr:glyoxylate/hydroxypyruvate reductase A [Wenzhouxiangella limi]NDY95443.1 glyoxylate/hydroxypyruvate reductase A [Wenzhouxiangella limi]